MFGIETAPNQRFARWFILGVILITQLGCGTSMSANQRFGEPPKGLSPEEESYRSHLLSQVIHENQCPEGFAPMQGQWRVAVPQTAQAPRNEIYFRGAEFTEFIANDMSPKKQYAIRRGRYACVDRNKIVFLVESVEPEGAFDSSSHDSYPCQVYWNPMAKRDTFALLCSFDWNPADSTGYSFQRVGY